MIAGLAQAVYFGVFFAAGLWMIAAQRQYVHRYAERVGRIPTNEELASEVLREPLRWPAMSAHQSWQYWRIVWQRQTDQELERVRLRVVRRWWLMVAVLVLGFPIVLIAMAASS